MRRLLWILVSLSAVGLIVVVLQQNETALAELTRFDASGLGTKIVALALLAMAVAIAVPAAVHPCARIGADLGGDRAAACARIHLPVRVARRRRPGAGGARPGPGGDPRARSRVRARAGGSFVVSAQVNGARLSMVLDTGATAVVLTQDAAKAAGLPLEVLSYSVTVDTANGRARAAPVTLDRVVGRRHHRAQRARR